jgi:putative effector of murein hydrolase
MPAGLFFGFLGVLSELEPSASSRDSSMALACSFLRNLKGVVDGPAIGTVVDDVDGASTICARALLCMARVRRPIRAGGGWGASSGAAGAVGILDADEVDGLEDGIGISETGEASGSSMMTRIDVRSR